MICWRVCAPLVIEYLPKKRPCGLFGSIHPFRKNASGKCTAPRLHCRDQDFIAVQKPFTLTIGVVIDPHHAAVEWLAEHLDDRPNVANQVGDGSLPLPNLHPIAV